MDAWRTLRGSIRRAIACLGEEEVIVAISELLECIGAGADCTIRPPGGLPQVAAGHVLPEDVHDFYARCGGVALGEASPYSISILPAAEVTLANPIIVGELCPEDISSRWYTIARDAHGQFLTIDLSPQRLGKCYDSFFDRHGVAGSCAIVAGSFTELLERLWNGRGRYWYWLEPDFRSLGDAYDAGRGGGG